MPEPTISSQESTGLLFTPVEDATVGLWLLALDLRNVDHPRFNLQNPRRDCCFGSLRAGSDRETAQYPLQACPTTLSDGLPTLRRRALLDCSEYASQHRAGRPQCCSDHHFPASTETKVACSLFRVAMKRVR